MKILLFLILFLFSLKAMTMNAESSGSTYYIKESDLKNFEEVAETNAETSIKLYLYYKFSKRDVCKASYWLKKSALLGNEVAQYNYIQDRIINKKYADAYEACQAWMPSNPEVKDMCLIKIPKKYKK